VTAVIDAPPGVVMVTADGETRAAETWPDGSYACGFCQTPVFSPAGWDAHEDGNAECYARNGETYTREPYSDYHRRHFEASECPNPMCVANLGAEALQRVRLDQRRDQERKDRDAAEKAREQAKIDAAAAREARAAEIHSAIGDMGRQLGFAWACTHTEKPQAYGAEPVMCEASGWDRGEYVAHLRDGHGAKIGPGYFKMARPFRLRKRPPAASLPKLEVSPFKFISWTETHTEPSMCKQCEHTSGDHLVRHSTEGVTFPCEQCDCVVPLTDKREFPEGAKQTAERRGQYWANGPAAHSVWVVPFELAPWETGQPALVLLYVGQPGKFHTHAYSAKYDRR
jgi:hypothetical protein